MVEKKNKIKEIREIKPDMNIINREPEQDFDDSEDLDNFQDFDDFQDFSSSGNFVAPVLSESESPVTLEHTAESLPSPTPSSLSQQNKDIPYSEFSVYEQDRAKYEQDTGTRRDFSLDDTRDTGRFEGFDAGLLPPSSSPISRGSYPGDNSSFSHQLSSQQESDGLREKQSFEQEQRRYEQDSRERERRKSRAA